MYATCATYLPQWHFLKWLTNSKHPVRRRMCTLHTLYQWRMKLDHLPLFEDEGREGAAESRMYPRKRNLVRLFNGAARRRQMNIFELAWRGVVPFRFAHCRFFLGLQLHSAIFSHFSHLFLDWLCGDRRTDRQTAIAGVGGPSSFDCNLLPRRKTASCPCPVQWESAFSPSIYPSFKCPNMRSAESPKMTVRCTLSVFESSKRNRFHSANQIASSCFPTRSAKKR